VNEDVDLLISEITAVDESLTVFQISGVKEDRQHSLAGHRHTHPRYLDALLHIQLLLLREHIEEAVDALRLCFVPPEKADLLRPIPLTHSLIVRALDRVVRRAEDFPPIYLTQQCVSIEDEVAVSPRPVQRLEPLPRSVLKR